MRLATSALFVSREARCKSEYRKIFQSSGNLEICNIKIDIGTSQNTVGSPSLCRLFVPSAPFQPIMANELHELDEISTTDRTSVQELQPNARKAHPRVWRELLRCACCTTLRCAVFTIVLVLLAGVGVGLAFGVAPLLRSGSGNGTDIAIVENTTFGIRTDSTDVTVSATTPMPTINATEMSRYTGKLEVRLRPPRASKLNFFLSLSRSSSSCTQFFSIPLSRKCHAQTLHFAFHVG